jgi:hypothetical protein
LHMHKLQYFLSLMTFYFVTESDDTVGKNASLFLHILGLAKGGWVGK